MRKGLVILLMWLGMLAGCNGEPSYTGLSFITYNYTPWDLDRVEITDKEGNSATTGAIIAGGGEGSVTCCYQLKGTDFKVQWRGADAEKAREHMFDGKLDEVIFNKETPVRFPAAEVPPGDGPLYLELHIYPDEHMELALSRKLLGQVRIPIVEVTRWLYAQHRDSLGDYRSSAEVRRVVAKVTRTAWTKYRLEDKQDLQEYMFLYFTVASNFNTDPDIAALLAKSGRQPGDFAKAVQALPADKIAHLKATGTAPGDKNG